MTKGLLLFALGSLGLGIYFYIDSSNSLLSLIFLSLFLISMWTAGKA